MASVQTHANRPGSDRTSVGVVSTRIIPVAALGLSLSRQSFFLGLAESIAWAWHIALVFGSLYNFFVRRLP